jgi:hypothetical protein
MGSPVVRARLRGAAGSGNHRCPASVRQHGCTRKARCRMAYSIFYVIGVVVVVLALLSVFGVF